MSAGKWPFAQSCRSRCPSRRSRSAAPTVMGQAGQVFPFLSWSESLVSLSPRYAAVVLPGYLHAPAFACNWQSELIGLVRCPRGTGSTFLTLRGTRF